MRKRLLLFIPVLIILAGFIAMHVLMNTKPETLTRELIPRKLLVKAIQVQYSDIPTQIAASGRLTSAQPITLYSEVAGTLQQGDVPFQPAQPFIKGDLLLKIDDCGIRMKINSAKSDLLNAMSSALSELKADYPDEYSKWRSYFKNCRFDEKLKPLPKTEQLEAKLILSRFNIYKIYYTVQELQIRLEKHSFYAPFNGSIVTTDLHVGSAARVGTKLGTIVNLDKMEVELAVHAMDINWIDHDKPVEFSSTELTGKWTGSITRIGKTIDNLMQTVPVYIKINRNADDHLYNGVMLDARIPGDSIDHALSVPGKAVYDNRFVYRVRDKKLDYVAVKIVRKCKTAVIVTDGLAAGDTLVIELLHDATPGMEAMAQLVDQNDVTSRYH